MAAVFRGRAQTTGRSVAVKRVLPNLSSNTEILRLFDDECRVHATLSHPKVVQYLAHGVDQQGPFLALDWVDGVSARHFVAPSRSLPALAAAMLALDVLDALDALHHGRATRGKVGPVLHRDLSPANVLVDSSGVSRLADFGLARALTFARTTTPGTTVGKLGYLAPEVLAGRPHSTRADLYALGVVLWEIIAGRRLLADLVSASDRTHAYLHAPRPRAERAREGMPTALARVIDGALAMDPAERFGSANAMAAVLDRGLTADEKALGRTLLACAARGDSTRRGRRRTHPTA